MKDNWCILCGEKATQLDGYYWQWRCNKCKMVSNVYLDAIHYFKQGVLIAIVPIGCLAVFSWERG